jgi:hypothetical protein
MRFAFDGRWLRTINMVKFGAGFISAALWLAATGHAAAQYTILEGMPGLSNKGADAALGIVIWNHGVSGNHDQSRYPPPAYVARLMREGWDVRRIARDGLYENDWTAAGVLHVKRTVEEATTAIAQGYKRIVLAGQSYGGGISQEAARLVEVWAIIPSASGFGTRDAGTPGAGANKTGELRRALSDMKVQRVVGIYPLRDENALGATDRGTVARAIATERGLAYLPLDERSALVGHGGSSSAQMDFSYGACVARFIDPAFSPKAGVNVCGRDGLPIGPERLKETDDLKPAALPSHEYWGAFRGVWIGAWGNPRLVSFAIEDSAQGYVLTMLEGQVNAATLNRRVSAPARLEGRTVAADLNGVTYILERIGVHVRAGWRQEARSGSGLVLRPDSGPLRHD